MRTNANRKKEMWEYARWMLVRELEEEVTVTRYWFPEPTHVSWKAIIASCPADLEARIEKTDGEEQLVIRRKE